MRIWSIHPQYLDAKGLVALWRETLLARNVLQGLTKGYTNHPQLQRFRKSQYPIKTIDQYLQGVYEEALRRAYNFNKNKFEVQDTSVVIPVTRGQVEYERQHLLKKLKKRDVKRYENFLFVDKVKVHPLFYIEDGDIEDWERV